MVFSYVSFKVYNSLIDFAYYYCMLYAIILLLVSDKNRGCLVVFAELFFLFLLLCKTNSRQATVCRLFSLFLFFRNHFNFNQCTFRKFLYCHTGTSGLSAEIFGVNFVKCCKIGHLF